jgi:hypothetical protein
VIIDAGIRDSGFGIRDSGFGIRDSGFGIRAKAYNIVIPAKAGIHFDFSTRTQWIPAFAGMTASRRAAMPSLHHLIQVEDR